MGFIRRLIAHADRRQEARIERKVLRIDRQRGGLYGRRRPMRLKPRRDGG
jgi:hypothetical protein